MQRVSVVLLCVEEITLKKRNLFMSKNNNRKYIPPIRYNPVIQAKKLDELYDRIDRFKDLLNAVNESYAQHLEHLANFAGHNMGNAIQSMYASLVGYDENESWVREIKASIDNLNGVLESFKRVVTYGNEKFTIPQLMSALATLTRSLCSINKVTTRYVYDRSDTKCLEIPFQSLLQVLLNMVSNSVKALRDVSIPKEIEIEARLLDGFCIFIVKDNGCGIADDIEDKIFNYRFSTTEGGSGIGLYFVRYIIEDTLHGEILLDKTNPNYSTIFTLKFPCK